jgi:hypothetical protein
MLVAQQLGNCYLLACLVAVAVLYTTTEVKVVKAYLVALWIADITHVALTLRGLGYERSTAIGSWNPTTWGNVGATVIALVTPLLCVSLTMVRGLPVPHALGLSARPVRP